MKQPHKARKRFGQNFLIDQELIAQIIGAIDAKPTDNLIEIGPGTGALTKHLIEICPTMSLIELDRDLIQILKTNFTNVQDFNIFNMDALKTDFSEFYDDRKLRLVGNLPYNISTPILFHLLSDGHLIEDMHFMLQREVVDRMSASPGDKRYGRLSVMIQYHCRVLPLIPVPPESFSPAPKIQSAVVRLKPYSNKPSSADNEILFSELVKLCFQQRRKTLRNCLKPYDDYLASLSSVIDLTVRPEQLSVREFVNLANIIHKFRVTGL